jgi:hypothetical protein
MSFQRNNIFTDNILILDGLTGTGKTLFAPLLGSMEGVQLPRFEYMIEYLCIASNNGSIKVDASKALLNLLADTKCYDGMISREINLRPNDLSGAFENKVLWRYLRQLFMPDGDAVMDRKIRENPILSFVTHQIFSSRKALFDAFGQRINLVEMVRHPFFLVDHWLSYQNRIGMHVRDLTLCGSHQDGTYPWFAESWKEEYASSNDFERVLLSISRLMEPIYTHAQNETYADRVMIIPFESFVLNPIPRIAELESKFNLRATKTTKEVMSAQRVPRKTLNAGPQKPIYLRYGVKTEDKHIDDKADYNNRKQRIEQYAMHNQTSKSVVTEFLNCTNRYEKIFGLWFN